MAKRDTLRGCLKNSPSSIWGQRFASIAPSDSEFESHMKEVEELKEKVKNMLLDSTKELTNNIRFINLLCRLGVNYHFENEINEQLNRIFTMLPKLLEANDYDLSTLANMFRVLRQYGYNMPSDVFKKFEGEKDGEFKKEIIDDVEGMLSLYESSFLAFRNEHILDKALSFTRKHLEVLAENASPSLQKHIRIALNFPSHRTLERLDALHYISYYKEDECANETLLKFAMMDYNGLQLLYRKELALLSKWWINTNLVEKVPYARDRLVESYVWAVGFIFEPQYSLGRLIFTKYTQLMTVMDDTYDSYGTIEELEVFTTALQRFTADVGEQFPEYMKHFYEILFEDLETNGTQGCENTIPERCIYKTSYLREMIKELVKSYLVEAHWRNDKKAPTFDEYIRNGKVTSTLDILASSCVLGMQDIGMKEIIWLRTDPDIAIGSKLITRLINDICAPNDETNREDFPKALDCYTKQYGVSQDEAIEAILDFLENQWKGMNEDLLKPTYMPRILLKCLLNYARTSHVFYSGIDMFTYKYHTKHLIESMFINPLQVEYQT